MTPTRYSSGPDVFAWLAREMTARGVPADAQRLEERSAAIKSRQRIDTKAAVEHLKDLAIAVKRARRAQAVAHGVWAMSPTSSNRQALNEAHEAYRQATEMLREECLQDQNLFDDVMRAVS